MCYLNKYTIKSDDSIDSIQARNLHSAQNVDWIGEIYNFRELLVCSANLNILTLLSLWISSSNLESHVSFLS